jgi:diguanylate cyclase (GGDEF)-like protein
VVDGSVSPRIGGRLAGALFVSCGALVGITAPIVPSPDGVNRPALVAMALVAVIAGAIVWELPWDRWRSSATLWLVPLAFGLMASHNWFTGIEGFRYPVFFFVTFAWLGVAHPPRTSLKVLPLAAAAYLGPLLSPQHRTAIALASALYALPVCVLVGEAVAWMAQRVRLTTIALEQTNRELESARAESQHRADLLATVARASGTMTSLRSEEVLRAVADSVVDLGLDVLCFAFFDDDAGTYRLSHLRGLPDVLAHRSFSADEGLAPLCRRERDTMVVDDYPAHPLAIPAIVQAGVQAAVLSPVDVDGEVPAVLIAAARRSIAVQADTVESIELLAAQAGRALTNASAHEQERRTSQALAEATVRDELTGIGNRRHAATLLESLLPGDAVLLLDVDHFKAINDSDGHAAGDKVLIAIGAYLRNYLRYEDSAARYGGEEFLVVLRQVTGSALDAAIRLLEGWRATRPRVTISIGVAVHAGDRSPAATLGHADAALYAAKRTGRDRVEHGALTGASWTRITGRATQSGSGESRPTTMGASPAPAPPSMPPPSAPRGHRRSPPRSRGCPGRG